MFSLNDLLNPPKPTLKLTDIKWDANQFDCRAAVVYQTAETSFDVYGEIIYGESMDPVCLNAFAVGSGVPAFVAIHHAELKLGVPSYCQETLHGSKASLKGRIPKGQLPKTNLPKLTPFEQVIYIEHQRNILGEHGLEMVEKPFPEHEGLSGALLKMFQD